MINRKTDLILAIKIIKNVQKYRDAAGLEIRVLEKINKKDPNNKSLCIHLIDWFNLSGHICLTFQRMGKSVYQFLKENRYRPFPINQIRHISYQLLSAVKFIHSIKLIHTDLKPENMLFVNSDFEFLESYKNVDNIKAKPPYSLRNGNFNHRESAHSPIGVNNTSSDEDNDNCRPYRCILNSEIKVIDFGSATFEWEHHSSIVGTRHYRAPEVILELGWDYPCDLWSVGCIIFELYHGRPLFMTHDNREHLMMMEKTLGYFPVSMIEDSPKKYFDKRNCVIFGEFCGDSESATRNCRILEDYCEFYCSKDKLQKKFSLESTNGCMIPGSRDSKSNSVLPEKDLHTAFFHLIRSLLTYQPKKRWTAREALQHPFFFDLFCTFGST